MSFLFKDQQSLGLLYHGKPCPFDFASRTGNEVKKLRMAQPFITEK